MQAIVVVPVYKAPSVDEEVSLRRCCEVLSQYPMALVCPDGLDVRCFHSLWNEYSLKIKEERFAPHFFNGVAGYNRLLLSKGFYSRFADYDYLLIYQPDAYVFRDELTEWCDKDYDYIGAPLVGDYSQKEYDCSMSLSCGNGGFSLRKVTTFMNFFAGRKHVFGIRQLGTRISFWKKPYTRWLVWLLMAFGWHNTPRWFSIHYRWNEDGFWSGLLNNSQYPLKQPVSEEALLFAFERFPKEMFEKTGKLPFGCHAWKKYEYEDFWKGYIK